MHIDLASLSLGVGIACLLQTALDRVAFKIVGRVMATAMGKRAVITALRDALLKLGEEKR